MRLASLLICVLATAGAFVKAQFHVSDPVRLPSLAVPVPPTRSLAGAVRG